MPSCEETLRNATKYTNPQTSEILEIRKYTAQSEGPNLLWTDEFGFRNINFSVTMLLNILMIDKYAVETETYEMVNATWKERKKPS